MKDSTMKIVKKLQLSGSRGICGVDYILKGENLYFMEINPRFQSSSEYLDKVLVEKDFQVCLSLITWRFMTKRALKRMWHLRRKNINTKKSERIYFRFLLRLLLKSGCFKILLFGQHLNNVAL